MIKQLLTHQNCKSYLQEKISEMLSIIQPEKDIICMCQICRNPIKLNEVVVRYAYGEFTRDEFTSIAFEEPQSTNTLGYAHIDCLEGKEMIDITKNVKYEECKDIQGKFNNL